MMKLETVIFLLVVLATSAMSIIAKSRRRRHRRPNPSRLPPGPRRLPVVGNILQLINLPPHKSMSNLASKHGPIMTLHIGAMTTIVISSAAAAREMFKYHDAALAGRVLYESMKLSYGHDGSIITAQLGARWRALRRICNAGLVAPWRLDAMQSVRRVCVDGLVRRVEEDGGKGTRAVEIRRLLFLTAFDHVGRITLSRDLLDEGLAAGADFLRCARVIMGLAGKPNVADLLPVLRGIDPQGIRREMEVHVGRALEIVAMFVRERMEMMVVEGGGNSDRPMDLLDALLRGDVESMNLQNINNFLFEMFMAGTETSASTMEWTMAELLRHPAAMSKVQAELRETVTTSSNLEEKDVMNLPYLNAVIKETMRLHPPLPLLVPHKAMKPCTLLGYHIPEGTQILVNVWALGRDPRSWEEPEIFMPERFMEGGSSHHLDYSGQHYEFIPFGSGRRMCPAVHLISRMLPLVLGRLLHSFDWALDGGMRPEDMDMRDQVGITLLKATPLSVIATPYIYKK